MKTPISISETYSDAWKYVRQNIGSLILATFIYLVIYGILSWLSGQNDNFFGFIFSIGASVISILFTAGMIRIGLSGPTHLPYTGDFSTDIRTFFNMIWGSIIAGFFALIGFLLLFIPGVIVTIRLSMVMQCVIDKRMTGWQAVKESWNITRGYSWKIFGFGLLTVLVFLISLIPLGLGVLVSIPLITIAQTLLYRRISANKEKEDDGADGYGKMVTDVPPTTPASDVPNSPIVSMEESDEGFVAPKF